MSKNELISSINFFIDEYLSLLAKYLLIYLNTNTNVQKWSNLDVCIT